MADDKPSDVQDSEFKVFVGGISYKVGERELKEMFDKFNPSGALIQVDKITQRPRGFGFVLFKDRESMLDAIREFHNKEVDGRTISVKEAIPMDQIKPGTRLGGGGERRGGYDRGGYGGSSRDSRYDSRGYGDRGYGDRGGYGGDRGAGYAGGDRSAYGGGYGDPRYPSYDRGGGYGDRGGYASYGGYERDPYYRDPYARDPYQQPYPAAGYERPSYDSRYASYDTRYPAADYSAGYDSDRYRAAGGPDRSRYPAPRPGPYDRPPADTRRDARSTR